MMTSAESMAAGISLQLVLEIARTRTSEQKNDVGRTPELLPFQLKVAIYIKKDRTGPPPNRPSLAINQTQLLGKRK